MARHEERRRRLYHDDEEPDPYGLETETDKLNATASPTSTGPSTGSLIDGDSPGWLSAMEKKSAVDSGREWSARKEEGVPFGTSQQTTEEGKRLAKGRAPEWPVRDEKGNRQSNRASLAAT